MKIIFICGSAEPGKDGVGDYTRLLAAEVIAQGNEAAIIALSDSYVEGCSEKAFSVKEGKILVNTLRISSTVNVTIANNLAKEYLKRFSPDWISLQFVPFSFNQKGLTYRFGKRIENIAGNINVHIMFHELWGGINNDRRRTLKDGVLFAMQKFFILRNINTIKPSVITTSIQVYKEALSKYKVSILPLFSNIQMYDSVVSKAASNIFRIVSFGTLSSDLEGLKKQLVWLKQVADMQGMEAEYMHMGSGGIYKESTLAIAKEIFGNDGVSDVGLLDEKDISAYLFGANAGISRADGLLWGKSGTTMAMLEHGLPVVLKGKRHLLSPSFDNDINYNGLLYFYDDRVIPLADGVRINALCAVADKMLKLLKTQN